MSLPSHSSDVGVIIQRIPFGPVQREPPQSCLPSSDPLSKPHFFLLFNSTHCSACCYSSRFPLLFPSHHHASSPQIPPPTPTSKNVTHSPTNSPPTSTLRTAQSTSQQHTSHTSRPDGPPNLISTRPTPATTNRNGTTRAARKWSTTKSPYGACVRSIISTAASAPATRGVCDRTFLNYMASQPLALMYYLKTTDRVTALSVVQDTTIICTPVARMLSVRAIFASASSGEREF